MAGECALWPYMKENEKKKKSSFPLSLELNLWMCLSVQIVSKKIFPLWLVKQVNIICVNYGSKIRLLESSMILIAVSIDSDIMKGKKKMPTFKEHKERSSCWVRDHINPTETDKLISISIPYLGVYIKCIVQSISTNKLHLSPKATYRGHPLLLPVGGTSHYG